MTSLGAANVIRVFDFYLALMFVLGLSRRYLVYWDAVRLLVAVHGRWPRLLTRLKAHHGVFVTTEVLRPLAVAVALMLTQFLCSRLIFPTAELTVNEMRAAVWPAAVILAAVVPMVAVDAYFLIFVGRFDRTSAEAYMDQAEHWLNSWQAPVVRAVTFGYVNPRRMVDVEVQKSLEQLSRTVSWAAWWVAAQVVCRMACGLTIWTVWAFVERQASAAP